MIVRAFFAFLVVCLAPPAAPQVYRWIDEQGRVHYSDRHPPAGAQARLLDIETRPAATDAGRSTLRGQGERLERRLAEEQRAETVDAEALRAQAGPRPVRGLDFRRYISLQRGMSEGEMLAIAGEPDLYADHGVVYALPVTVPVHRTLRLPGQVGLTMKSYTWLPTPADPFVTTVTVVGGRVTELERVRRF